MNIHDAERSVLGSVLLEPGRMIDAKAVLAPDDFSLPAHRDAFSAMCDLVDEGQPIDLLLMSDRMQRAGTIDGIGGPAGLAGLMDSVPTGAHVEHYAKLVVAESRKRTFSNLVYSAVAGIEEHGDYAEVKRVLQEGLFSLDETGTDRPPQNIKALLRNGLEQLSANLGGRPVLGLETGYFELDGALTGFRDQQLIIVAGRPGMGKSTFALNLARNIVRNGTGALFFEMEMSDEELTRNMWAREARVDAQRIRTLSVSDRELASLSTACDALHDRPLWIDDNPGQSITQIRNRARQWKRRHDIGLVIVDYLQLATAPEYRRAGREQEVSAISRGLKCMAKELKIPVVALAQLSRKPDARKDPRPILSDLRESGAIEQDADVVLFVHRPDVYGDTDYIGKAQLIIAKQRNGPTGTVELSYIRDQFRFENLSYKQE